MLGPNAVPLYLDELFWEKTRSQIGLRGWALKSASNAITLLLFHPLTQRSINPSIYNQIISLDVQ